MAELQAGWRIWDFVRTIAHYRGAEIAVQIARLQYQRVRQTVAFDVEHGYFRSLEYRASVAVADDAIKRAEEYRRVSITELNRTMDVDVTADLNLIDDRSVPQVAVTLPEALRAAFSLRYEIALANDWIAQAREQRKVARSDFNPELLGGGSYSSLSEEGTTSDMWIGGVRLKWDVYEGGRRIGELRKADARIAESTTTASDRPRSSGEPGVISR